MKTTLQTINQMQADGIIGKYAIGGAVGATFYLEPSATLDVDIFISFPSPPGSLLLSLHPIYDYLRARGFQSQGEYILIGGWPVQFLPVRDALEEEGLTQAIQTDVDGVPTWVMPAEHLIAIALRTGRSKDFARIVQFWNDDETLDKDKLRSILTRHGLEPKWRDFERRYLRD
jgi:hypothetical protein